MDGVVKRERQVIGLIFANSLETVVEPLYSAEVGWQRPGSV